MDGYIEIKMERYIGEREREREKIKDQEREREN